MSDADALPSTRLDLARVSLFLDLDGTLAPIMARPDDVGPQPARTALLQSLEARLQGRLAVISGRVIADVDRILDQAVPAVAGVHGLERRGPDGQHRRTPPHPALAEARRDLERFAARLAGVSVEDKTLSLAVHFRAAPAAGPPVVAEARRLADRFGLAVQAGDMVVELRTPGPDKGDAVAFFMGDPPFADAMPVFVGDDLTDEAGFAAAARLGGYGVLVGPPRTTAARERLADPKAVLAWLAQALAVKELT